MIRKYTSETLLHHFFVAYNWKQKDLPTVKKNKYLRLRMMSQLVSLGTDSRIW